MTKKFSRLLVALFLTVFGLTTAAHSQTSPSKDFPNIKISNFGKMDDRFYRGGQPKKGSYEALKALGIHTIIDLTDKPKDYEKEEVEALGMRYVNIPIPDKSYPTDELVTSFLKTVDDPETGVFYVHCAGGRHRTGDMGAVYRFTKYGWDYDKVYQEMKNYDFYSSWGHGKQKDFVSDYASKVKAPATAVAAPAVAVKTM
jgi:protein tyrosine/serine phosphatase